MHTPYPKKRDKMKKWSELSYEEKLDCIRLFPKEAKRDENWHVRLKAYHALGWTEEAKRDSDKDIRIGAYRALGWTEEAKQDLDYDIREEAELYFKIKGE